MQHGVLKHFHPMIGCDFHKLMPPGSPTPGPPAPHVAMSSLMGLGITAQMGPTEFTHFGWTIMRGSDIGPMIPHAGAPNCLLPLILLASGSKAEFGSSQCLIANKPVAAALAVVVNPNLNCGDPAPAPLDGVVAITAHFVGMTWGDIIAGFANMAFDSGLQYVLNKLGDKLFENLTQKVYEKFLVGPMMSMFEHMGEGRVAAWLFKNDFVEMMAKGFFQPLTQLIGGWTIGSPVGYSLPWNGLGKLDGLASDTPDGPGAIEQSHNAVRDYIDSPSVETHDNLDGGVSDADAGVADANPSGQQGTAPDAGSDTPAVDTDPNSSSSVDPSSSSSSSVDPSSASSSSSTDRSSSSFSSQTPADDPG
ncbi:MAG TPA: hypothetical protein VHG72_07765, partial [Polyangia bacterium]|nr:hypothetical protein [Polyangia bacterium]